MWIIVCVSLLLGVNDVLGGNPDFEHVSNGSKSFDESVMRSNEEVGTFFSRLLNESFNSVLSSGNGTEERFESESSSEGGRGFKLKQKIAAFRNLQTIYLVIKIIAGLIISLGFVITKIMAFTSFPLSLLAVKLAMLLFLKDYITRKNSPAPVSIVPSVYYSGGLNDLVWNRQGNQNGAYPWNAS